MPTTRAWIPKPDYRLVIANIHFVKPEVPSLYTEVLICPVDEIVRPVHIFRAGPGGRAVEVPGIWAPLPAPEEAS